MTSFDRPSRCRKTARDASTDCRRTAAGLVASVPGLGVTLALVVTLGVTLGATLTVTPAAQARDGASPPLADDLAAPPGTSWHGMLWSGPRSGAPAAPSAADCARPPRPVDIAEPRSPQGHGVPIAGATERRALSLAGAAARRADGPVAAPATLAGAAAPPKLLREPAMAAAPMPPSPPSPPGAAPLPAPVRAQGGLTPAVAPTDAAVTAGVVDDNADFGAYLAYRERQAARVRVRDRDISERYRIVVHDREGRAVPDARIEVSAGGQPLPLWARTDAAGQAWLHPRVAGVAARDLTLRVSRPGPFGERHGTALLRRGQRDAVQVDLDGTVPAGRARLDITFLVDATGSMGDEIDKLERSMHAVARQIDALPGQPDVCYALVAYRDRGDEFFVRAWDFSHDLDAFQNELAALRASGGGDYPEALNEALHTAVHRLSWRGDGATRLVLLVADAPPHLDDGQPWYDDDMQGALARGIKVFSLAASGLDASGEYIFRQLAQYTGGRFVFLTYARAHDPSSGPGRETVHDVSGYSVETLDRLIVRLVREELARRPPVS